MEASKDASASALLANTPSRRLIALLRDRDLAPLLRALLLNGFSQLRNISPAYFTYDLEGEDVIVNDSDLATVVQILSDATGRPKLGTVDVVLPGLEGQICKQLMGDHRDAAISAILDLFLNEDLAD